MDQFEKVEKLAEKAGVRFEVARDALVAANWDLLDAMIALEKQGDTEYAGGSAYSTRYDDQPGYRPIEDRRSRRERRREERREQKRRCLDRIHGMFRKLSDNHVVLTHEGKKYIDLPIWLFVIILLAAWRLAVLLILVSLLLGCRYSLVGPDRMESANNALDAVSGMADKIAKKLDSLHDSNRSSEDADESACEGEEKEE